MSQISEFFTIQPSQRDHVPAARIALSVAIPLLVLLLVDRTDLAIYAAFGAFTSIYARNEPARARAAHQSWAGLLVVLCVMLGALLSDVGAPEPAVLAVTAVVAGVGALLAAYLTLKPAGSLFFIFATGAIGTLPDAAPCGRPVRLPPSPQHCPWASVPLSPSWARACGAPSHPFLRTTA